MMKLPKSIQIERSGHTLTVNMKADANLIYFKGHFESAPVLAGVVQVGWVIQLIEAEFAVNLLFKGLKLVKFTRLILPETALTLTLQYKPGDCTIKFQINDLDERCASGLLMFELAS